MARTTRSLCLALVFLAVSAGARAGDHKADVFMAPSYLGAKGGSIVDLGGWHASGALTLKKKKQVSFIADLSQHFFHFPGSDNEKDLTQFTLMVGPRFTFLGGGHQMPFVHFMALGAVFSNDGKLRTDLATGAVAFGAGHDFVPEKHGPWGLRAQFDYIVPLGSDLKSSFRISVGWIYRFRSPHCPDGSEPKEVPCGCASN